MGQLTGLLDKTAKKSAARTLAEAGVAVMLVVTVIVSALRGGDIHWVGLAIMLMSYAAVYYVGVAAASSRSDSLEDMIVADRSLPL